MVASLYTINTSFLFLLFLLCPFSLFSYSALSILILIYPFMLFLFWGWWGGEHFFLSLTQVSGLSWAPMGMLLISSWPEKLQTPITRISPKEDALRPRSAVVKNWGDFFFQICRS